jgi:predicted Zn finger-like uncharacterized protein
MKITCQSCQSKYNVADEKVQGKIVKIRCRKCGGTIVVNATAGGANGTRGGEDAAVSLAPQPSMAAAPAAGGEWHVNFGDSDQRQMSLADLVAAYNAGTVTQDTFIWTDGMDDWRPLAEVEPVVSALHAAAEAPAAAAYAVASPRAAFGGLSSTGGGLPSSGCGGAGVRRTFLRRRGGRARCRGQARRGEARGARARPVQHARR